MAAGRRRLSAAGVATRDDPRVGALEPLFQSALEFHEQGHWARAEHLYREVLRQHPTHAAALAMLGVLACQSGHRDAGIGLLQRALVLEPDNPDFNNNLGQACFERGDAAAARAAFERAVAARPRFPAAHCNLGNACRMLGEPATAERHYRRALELDPRHLDALQNLATLLREAGRADEALNCAERAARLAPRDARVQATLALCAAAARRFDTAARACVAALALDPENGRIWALLGDCRRRLGALTEAAAAYREAAARDSGRPDVWLALGTTEFARGLLDEARESYARAEALEPNDAQTSTLIGMVAAAHGDRDAARGHFARALALRPGHGEAWRQLAESIDGAGEARAALDELEAVRGREDLSPRDRSDLDFACGRLCDLAGEPARAFAAWQRANAARRAETAFDASAQARFIDAIIATFDEDWFARSAGAGSPAEQPLLVIGMPRSGTTLVEQILASHPAVHGAGELTFWPERLGRAGALAAPYPAALAGGVAALGELARDYLELLVARAGDALRVTDKMPYNFLYLGPIAALLRGARFVHCRRHPLATCFSLYTHDLAGNHPYAYALTDLAAAYAGYARLMAHWLRVLPGRIVEVDYETLVREPEAESRRLLAFAGLPWDPACLRFQDTRRPVTTASQWQVRRPVYRDALEHWRRYADELAPLAAALTAHGVVL